MTESPGGRPDLVSPMHVSAGSGQPPSGPDWVVELAWTGHRCIAYVEPGRTRLLSANDVSMTATYPELAAPLERRCPPGGLVLDGTLVARGEEHAPRPRLLKRRHGRFRPTEQHIRDVPVDYQVTDLLWLDGHSTVDLAYRDRRALLEGLGFDSAPVWTTSPLPVSELDTVLRIADAKGVDALHARHLASRYRPGGRSPLWVKVPVPRVRQVVVGGWTATDPARPDTIASLLLGVPDGDRAPDDAGLRYVGRVGVAADQRRQVADLRNLHRDGSPFAAGAGVPGDVARTAIWVRPELVGLVEFTGFGPGGRLRLPHWRGRVDPDDVPGLDSAGAARVEGAVEGSRWARPAEPPPRRAAEPRAAPTRSPVVPPAASQPGQDPAATAVESRRLEQHFVYNALNTIGSLIRTDPARARELLFGFADLSRAADQPGGAPITLGRELDAVRGYLQLEKARFGDRLRIRLDVDATLHGAPVEPMRVLAAVRDAVQRHIEPRPDGGELAVTAHLAEHGCTVTVVGGAGVPAVIALPAPTMPGAARR